MSYTHMVTKLFDVVQARDSVALRQLLEDQGDPNAADANSGDSVLHRATFNNDLDSVQILLDAHADVDSINRHKFSPLHWAAYCGYREAAEMLLNYGADIERKGMNAYRPLHWAAYAGQKEVFDMLLRRKATTDCLTANRESLLHVAALNSQVSMLHHLLNLKSDINAVDLRGNSSLMRACASNLEKSARFLYHHGASLSIRNSDGHNAQKLSPYLIATFREEQLEGWTPYTHHRQVLPIQHTVETLMAIHCLEPEGILSALPREVLYIIFYFFRPSWWSK